MRQISRKWWDIAVVILMACGLLLALGRTIADLDLWGHVQWGVEFIQQGKILQVDPYSYMTEGQRWIDHQWLGDGLMGLVWLKADASGLLMMKYTTWLIVTGLIFSWLWRSTPGISPLRPALILIAGMPILTGFTSTIRPVMFTALCYTLMLLILQQAEAGKLRWLWGLPVVLLCWVNLHGAWLMGLGLLGIWTVVFLITHRSRQDWSGILPPILLSGLVTLINPFGFDLWTFMIQHLPEARQEITEWQPLAIRSLFGAAYLAWLVLCLAGVGYSQRKRNPASLTILVSSMLLPLLASRHLLFFILSALVIAGPYLLEIFERKLPSPDPQKPVRALAIGLVLLVAGLLLIWKPPNLKNLAFKKGDFPIGATELLKQAQVKANLAVFYNWGHYISWHLAPDVKVSVDTRREQAYSTEAYHTNLRFLTASGDWDSLLEDYPTDLVLAPPGHVTDSLLGLLPEWSLVYEDEASHLYARAGSELAERLKQTGRNFSAQPDTEFP